MSISSGVVVGQSNGKQSKIGNNVVLMLDSKVLGAEVGNNIAVGAASLVIRDIKEEYSVYAGLPVKKVSNNYPIEHFEKYKKMTFLKN